MITQNPKTGKYKCFSKYHPIEKRWVKHGNSPHDGDPNSYPSAWPKLGGGGDMELELSQDDLFKRMVAWDQQNYIVGAGTKGTSDKHSTGGLGKTTEVILQHNCETILTQIFRNKKWITTPIQ